MNPPSERRFPRLPLAKAAASHEGTKPRRRGKAKRPISFASIPSCLRGFVASCETSSTPAAFREDLIDACMMENIHVWRRGLQPLCGGQGNAFAWLVQRGCKPLLHITHLHQTLNASSHPIRNRLLRLTADSPDLLAIIKQEGKV